MRGTTSVANAASAFRATGLFPFDQAAISCHFFSLSDSVETSEATEPDRSVSSQQPA